MVDRHTKKHKYKSPFPVDLQSTESLPSSLFFVLTTLCSGRTNPIPISYVRMWMPEEKQACWRAGFCVCACVEGAQGERGGGGRRELLAGSHLSQTIAPAARPAHQRQDSQRETGIRNTEQPTKPMYLASLCSH